MPEYYCCEADRCHTIGLYMNKCHCEVFFSIDLNRSNNDTEEKILEEMVIKTNTYIYDSNGTHILKVGETVMNIENVMESVIVVTFENETNNMLMRVGRIDMNSFSIIKVWYVHPNNPTFINTLACS